MIGSITRVARAFAHQAPDRTPLFEIFQPYQPIHWDICGRTVGTDMTMAWDARADGIAWEELIEAEAQAAYRIARYFGLDMVLLNSATSKDYPRPTKLGPGRWLLGGVEYMRNPRTQLVVLAHPAEEDSYSHRHSEAGIREQVECWDGTVPAVDAVNPVYRRVRELAEADGQEWVYMGEVGAGTGVSFYSPDLLMLMLTEPELYQRWLAIQAATGYARTRALVAQGHTVVAIGGDVSCDKGPFISPALYHAYILPVIQEQVRIIHQGGAQAVYTSDGNHWPIKDDFFFHSGIDGYQEVDKAAGMTFARLIAEGIDEKICIIGNLDARHILCHGTHEEVRAEVLTCLRDGQHSPGGHILHASHSVHEDVRPENYITAVKTYREFFGMEPLSR